MFRGGRVLAPLILIFLIGSDPALRAGPPAPVGATFNETFNSEGVLQEAGSMSASSSPYWWLSSGAYLYFRGGLGATVQGTLGTNNYWRRFYSQTNPTDTDAGYRPQNIFRLVSRSRWQNFRQQAYFRIRRDNPSASPNRSASNGLLLMSRYQNDNNLYYAGIRVDGDAVIKKKYGGKYTTLASAPVFPGAYDRTSSPSLLPKDLWLGVRSELRNNRDGTVRITLYVDPGPGGWVLVFDVLDNGLAHGPAITSPGYAGIRTDFMDVELENYWAVKLD
jgi:hypothetical protein